MRDRSAKNFKVKAPIVIQVEGGKLAPVKGQCPKGLSGSHDPKIHTAITISTESGLEQSACTETEPGLSAMTTTPHVEVITS